MFGRVQCLQRNCFTPQLLLVNFFLGIGINTSCAVKDTIFAIVKCLAKRTINAVSAESMQAAPSQCREGFKISIDIGRYQSSTLCAGPAAVAHAILSPFHTQRRPAERKKNGPSYINNPN